MEYSGKISSTQINGEVTLCVEEDGLAIISPLDAYHIPYADVNLLEIKNYAVNITTEVGKYTVEWLGNDCEPFFDELYSAYNKKVRKALFVSGSPFLSTKGEYSFTENGITFKGVAPIEVYEDCIVFLPPNTQARRVPLCFVTAIERGAFTHTLHLDISESYTFSKLGYDTEPFDDALTRRLHAIRKQALDEVKALDASLGIAQVATIAKLMPFGILASMGSLSAVAPSFARVLEAKIDDSGAAESYSVLKTVCATEQICVGIRQNFGRGSIIDNPDKNENNETLEETEAATDDASKKAGDETEANNMVWILAPNIKGGIAALEFAVAENESAATFIYRFEGSFEHFTRSFNRAIEAVAFKREVIRLSDTELRKPEYSEYAMAVNRNTSLQFIRSCFSGRVIHSSPERWKQGLLKFMNEH